jgi:hypothetical protein
MDKRQSIPRRGHAPNWVLRYAEDHPDEMESAWEIHNIGSAQWIPQVDAESISELVNFLKPARLPTGVAALLASDLACGYLRHLEYLIQAPRDGRVTAELEAIRNASIQLQRALRAASGHTLRGLQGEITTSVLYERVGTPSMEWDLELSKDWQRLRRSSALLFSADRTTSFDLAQPNPEFMDSLADLVRAVEIRKGKIPPDRGGPKSGQHDSTGANARIALAMEGRRILRYLGLPYGAQKGGPVSRFIALVHQAVKEEPPSWADRLAAMTPNLERVLERMLETLGSEG